MTKLTIEEKVMKCVLFQIRISDPDHVIAQWEKRKLFLMHQHLFQILGVNETNRLMGEARKTLAMMGLEPEKTVPIANGGTGHDWWDIKQVKFV